MPCAELAEASAPERGQGEPHHALVVGIGPAPDETGRLGPVHESDGTVMPEQEGFGDVANGGILGILVSTDREEELMLSGGEPRCGGLFVAPVQESAESGAEVEKSLVVSVGKVRGHRRIVSR